MSNPFMFEKPLGMNDTLPPLFNRTKDIEEAIDAEVRLWGYNMLHTPALEYYETVGAASAIHDAKLFKLLDKEGRTLVLRPDMTAPIARVASSGLQEMPFPLRLSYNTYLYRAQVNEGGRPAEFQQYGVELIGDRTMNADGEAMALMAFSLKRTGLDGFRIAFGHIGFMNALFKEIVGQGQGVAELKQYLYEKNYVGFKQRVEQLSVSSLEKNRLLQLLSLRGGLEVLDTAKTLVTSPEALRSLEEIKDVWHVLESYGVSEYMNIDLNLVMHIDYYTGVVFESYAFDLGFPLGSGGRYDELLPKFGREASATGFGLRLDRLVEALDHVEPPTSEKTTLILFSKERQQEAFQQAQSLRKTGQSVVLQNVAGVMDLDQFTSQYTDTLQLIGGRSS
ncbi:ATP phosphoribosyltransferase regulatory subunit [Geomicrobium sp. JSM 1781026]|uniref:ATP phosphoribosyltransferase regulatory subunit n=1 Tax=Geomicrobium sp. JSM 1781026 TaxID=3344580 RepID=UPI0035BF1F9A